MPGVVQPAEHEAQLYDLLLVREGAVPKTSSGKVQRSSCRAAYLDRVGINVLIGADPVPPNGGAAFHDTAIWMRAA